MRFNEHLKQWFTKFQKYKVTYKDGFFRVSTLANSPFTIIQSFVNTPFCKHNTLKKLITANTLFLNVELYYAELEEGLWILVSDLKLKKNMVIKNIYDDSLPANFNLINLHYNNKTFKSKSMLIDGLALADKTWSVFKAGYVSETYHFKDSHENNVTIYFTNEWLKKQQKDKKNLTNKNFSQFFKSSNSYYLSTDTALSSDDMYQQFRNFFVKNSNSSTPTQIIKQVHSFFNYFIDHCMKDETTKDYFKIQDKDRKCVLEAEKYLVDNLLTAFPGIEQVAQKVGVSGTKLKMDFKTVHHQSLYHYYRYHQMHLANKLLTKKPTTVKEVASLLGYENASKFAAVFKEQFGLVPSSVGKE